MFALSFQMALTIYIERIALTGTLTANVQQKYFIPLLKVETLFIQVCTKTGHVT